MDNSIEYIEMCSKAIEIQEPYKDKCGVDLEWGTFIVEDGDVNCIGGYTVDDRGVLNDLESFIVLPTQDQLQDMIDDNLSNKIDRFYAMFNKAIVTPIAHIDPERLESFQKQLSEAMEQDSPLIIFNAEDDINLEFLGNCRLESMEQMWLSFVMKEKYNKTWNKETKQWITKK